MSKPVIPDKTPQPTPVENLWPRPDSVQCMECGGRSFNTGGAHYACLKGHNQMCFTGFDDPAYF